MMNQSKKQSSDSIEMSKRVKSDYQKAKEYFKVSYLTAPEAAKKTKYGISYKTIDGRKVRKDKDINDSPEFKEEFKNWIVNKWKRETREYFNTYRMTFNVIEKGISKPSLHQHYISVKGRNNKELLKKAKEELEYRRDLYARESGADVESFVLDKEPVSEKIEYKEGKGVTINNGKVVSTLSGGQRKVGSKGHKAGIKMRDRFALKFAGDENQEWDRGEGTCVFDYLIYKYKDVKGFKKDFKAKDFDGDVYKYIDDLLRIDETERPLIDGVSVYQLENFCDKYGISMYAFDKTDGLIEYFKPANWVSRGEKPPLIFTCFDNHFSPVEDKKKRLRMSSKASSSGETNWTSNELENYNKKKTGDNPKRKVIAPTKEEYEEIKEIIKDKKIQINNYIAIEFLKKNKMEIPYPLNEKSLFIDDGSIKKLIYDDKIVLTEPIDERIRNYYEGNTEDYTGQTYITIMNNIWEKSYNCRFSDAPFMSKINGDIATTLSAEKVKWRTHLGMTPEGLYKGLDTDKIRDLIKENKAVAVDISKCYSDCLYNPRERWIVFSGKEMLEVYDREPLTLGLYFVITDDMTLFHQSNWYSKQIIMKARKEGICFRITHQIRCVEPDWEYLKEKTETKEETETISGYHLKNDETLFRNFCDKVIEETEVDEDFTLAKLILNSITGMLGKSIYTTKNVSIGKSLEETWEDWVVPQVQENPNIELFVNPINPSDNKEDIIYMYGYDIKSVKTTNGLPMYIQILDWSNMALYDLAKDVGGTCVYRKTDMIVSIGGVIPQDKTIKYPCHYTDTFGKYRVEPNAEKLNYDFEMNIFRSVETPIVSDDWVYWDYNDSNDWKLIIEKAIEKGGMLVKGRAGTGKSYIVEQGMKSGLLPTNAKSRLAPTNRAARNIGGTTIHKALGINKNDKLNDACLYGAGSAAKIIIGETEYKIFIIDEISMINCNIWNKLLLLKKKTNAIFILLGDYRQCPPIENGKSIDYFNHSYPKLLTNSNCCELTTPKRYDLELWNWLEKFYEEGIEEDAISKKKVGIEDILYRRNICFYNDTRKYINELCMDKMTNSKLIKRFMALNVPDKCKNDKAQKTYLYIGLPIMAIVNNKDLDMINSDEYIVKDFDPNANTIVITGEDGEDLSIDFKDFHRLFAVNYAATTHKSQGATIQEDINIFDWDRLSTDRRVGYTAVSRGKKCEQVTIVENYYEYQFKFNREAEEAEDNDWIEDDL